MALAVIFTSYLYLTSQSYLYLTSQVASAGYCSVFSTTVTLESAFTVVVGDPATRLLEPDDAASSLKEFLGLETCAAGPSPSALDVIGNGTVTYYGTAGESLTTSTRASMSNTTKPASKTTTIAVSSILSSAVAAPTGMPAPRSTSTQTRIALGVGLSLGSVLICLSLVLALRRYRKTKRLVHSSNDEDPAIPGDDRPPYLQPKGELDAHGNSKFELDAGQRRYELGATEVHEMETGDVTHGRRELRGEEHSSEMTA